MPTNGQILNPYQAYPDDGEPFPFWAKPVYVADENAAQNHGVQVGEYYTPGIYGATYAASPWDKLFLGVPFVSPGQPFTPGICTITVSKKRNVDKKKAAGSDGARYTVHGIDPAEVTIQVKIWTPAQYFQLIDLWTTLFPGPVKKSKITTRTVTLPETSRREQHGDQRQIIPQVQQTRKISSTSTSIVTETTPFDVDHPMLHQHKIKSLLFVEGTGPDPGDTPRSKIFTMRAFEFLQPSKNKTSHTPVASKGSRYDPGKENTPGLNPKNLAP